ncbi:phosphotransferase enzyme family protein [Arthrobacter crystallopoietes BAB-32]|uniref:Phosphotransferase enzyme family protein n=1 Tax=Arthrobacter crystallopoietes BAB-32 TaxID=1246476 RepID=N1UX47_9MICC|nr:macrolide 2'-phosphotransferase [Arthrobacter crystallopoietes]EMY32314.1 phosphotransferase enzyme family protein [Arthrobacter crystallopoietes BAB-32]
MTEATEYTPEYVADLAQEHGLDIIPASVVFEEAGLDYLVAFATAKNGKTWVLRIPRRADVSAKISEEARILKLVKGRLSAAVPDWRIRNRSLVAYPALPGQPGLTLDGGEVSWHFDRESPAYCRSLGRLIAQLHRIDAETAQAAGILTLTPAEVREEWRTNLAKVNAEFSISESLLDRWTAWLEEDSFWPEFTVFTHGELYPAHLLLDEDAEITGVLDWTTAKVSDPALDFTFHHSLSTPEAFELTVRTYVEEGGRIPQRLGDQCAEIMAAAPINYGVYALTTGNPDHWAAAAAQLDPMD